MKAKLRVHVVTVLFFLILASACNHKEPTPTAAPASPTQAPAVAPSPVPPSPVPPSPAPGQPTPPKPTQVTPAPRKHVATALDPIQAENDQRNLIAFQHQLLTREILRRNEHLSEVLREMPPAEPQDTTHKFNLTYEQAVQLYDWLYDHPVAAMYREGKYDQTGGVGFCFGRAFTVHIEALSKDWKVDRDSIRKLWAIGPMSDGNGGTKAEWGHHVAIMIRAAEGGWWVIDPVAGVIDGEGGHRSRKVVQASTWMELVTRTYQITGVSPLWYAVTKPERFGPDLTRAYSQIDLYGAVGRSRTIQHNDFYKGFFKDVIEQRRKDGGTDQPGTGSESESESEAETDN